MSPEGTTEVRKHRTDRWVYRDYTGDFSARQARTLLAVLALIVVLAEVAVRIVGPEDRRTSQNSMHGLRTQLLQMEEDPRPKIVGVGDSSLQGGGVLRDEDTGMGMLWTDLRGTHSVYNLGVPGGTAYTNKFLLEVIRNRPIENVDRVIVEMIPSKFMVPKKGAPTLEESGLASVQELNRFLPFADARALGIPSDPLNRDVAIEYRFQYGLAKLSHLYRMRDAFKNRIVGGYPAFWFAASLLPNNIRKRMLADKGDGNNRLAAQTEDVPYRPQMGKPSDREVYFSDRGQFEMLRDTLRQAKRISKKPPVLLIHPTHFEYQKISERQRRLHLQALRDMGRSMERLAREEGVELVVVPSNEYQDPSFWTKTTAHFNERLHRIVFERLRAKLP
ncbi:MAG TPA: hypothetical protein VGE01_10295 [Fimbriimonas sp.]